MPDPTELGSFRVFIFNIRSRRQAVGMLLIGAGLGLAAVRRS